MVKLKRLLKIVYVAICIAIATIILTKIFAAGTPTNIVKIGSVDYGWYLTEIKGDKVTASTPSISENKSIINYQWKPSTTDRSTIENLAKKDPVLWNELSTYFDVFCLNKKAALPSDNGLPDGNPVEESTVKIKYWPKQNFSTTLDLSHKYGAADTATFTTAKRKDEKITLSSDPDTSYDYYSREIHPENLTVTEAVTDNLLEGGTRPNGAYRIDWDEAYIFSQVDSSVTDTYSDGQLPYNIYQWALWKSLNPNDTSITLDDTKYKATELFNRAQAFKSYRNELETNNKVSAKNGEKGYKYKENKDKNYFLAGPINITYGNLQMDYDGYDNSGTKVVKKLNVKLITDYNLYGKDKYGNERLIEKEKYTFTDESGTPLTSKQPAIYEGTTKISQEFPLSGKDFYIKIDNSDPIYSELDEYGNVISAITSISAFEINYKTLDIEAKGYKIEDTQKNAIRFYQWEPIKTADFWENESGGYPTHASGAHDSCLESHFLYSDYYEQYLQYYQGPMNDNDTIILTTRRDGVVYNTGGTSTAYEWYRRTSWGSTENCQIHGTNCLINIRHHINPKLKRNGYKETELQPIFILGSADLFWQEYVFKIYFEPEPPTGTPTTSTPTGTPTSTPTGTPTTGTPSTGTPTTTTPTTNTPSTPTSTPTNYMDTFIDIGGKVWVDTVPSNKREELNGIYDENNPNLDYPRKNVLVKLYFEDGQQVKEGTTYVEVTLSNGQKQTRPVTVARDTKNDPNLIPSWPQKYEMYTKDDGSYMFYDLPFDVQYYVEFTYDGLEYEPVEYLVGLNEPKETAYKNDPNNPVNDNNSKVKEEGTGTKAGVTREQFNEQFKEIGYNYNTYDEKRLVMYNTNGNFAINGTIRENQQSAAYPYTRSTNKFLEYITKKYDGQEKRIQSRLVTTDNLADVENEIQTGKAKEYAQMSARTIIGLEYPFYDSNGFVTIDIVENNKPKYNLDYLKHINLGLQRREKFNFVVENQLKGGASTIKHKDKTIFYKTDSDENLLNVDYTSVKNEYIKQEISKADYDWKSIYNNIYDRDYYDTATDGLNFYVLYRIAITASRENTNDYGVVNGMIDYFNKELIPVPPAEQEKAYKLFVGDKKLNNTLTTANYAYSWVDGTNYTVKWDGYDECYASGRFDESKLYCEYNNDYYQLEFSNGVLEKMPNGETKRRELEIGKEKPTQAIYLILKLKEQPNGKLYKGTETTSSTDRDKDGAENIAEIRNYEIRTGNGKIAGKVDSKSIPGNAVPGNKDTYEYDTGRAPMFSLVENWEPRTISGNVWEDINGDGKIDSGKGIKDVLVQLIEYIPVYNKDTKKVDRVIEFTRPGIKLVEGQDITVGNLKIKTDSNGNYSFNVEAGNYSLKFEYGNTEMLLENVKYNAQDYQATQSYSALHSGSVPGYDEYYIEANKNAANAAFANTADLIKYLNTEGNEGRILGIPGVDEVVVIGNSRNKKVAKQNIISKEDSNYGKDASANNLSNVRDLTTDRKEIIKNAAVLKYKNSSLLNNLNSDITNTNIAKQLSGEIGGENYTHMRSVSDIITIASNDLVPTPKIINFGLKERPINSVKLEKYVTRIVVTAADGQTVLIDTQDAAKQSGLAKDPVPNTNINPTYRDIQTTLMYLASTAMDGATLDIDYEIIITREGNQDKLSNYKYIDSDEAELTAFAGTLGTLLGNISIGYNDPLPVIAHVYDYVNINLEYRADDNKDASGNEIWTLYDNIKYDSTKKITASKNDFIELSDDVNKTLPRDQKKVSKVLAVKTKDLTPESNKSQTIPLHLGIVLAENTGAHITNEFVYSNCAEIVQIDTGSGRRDYKTVQGNYIPYSKVTKSPASAVKGSFDDDADITGTTTIVPPTGQERIYYVITALVAGIIITGVLIIKKKVLKK